jgi:hypothetical protein
MWTNDFILNVRINWRGKLGRKINLWVMFLLNYVRRIAMRKIVMYFFFF